MAQRKRRRDCPRASPRRASGASRQPAVRAPVSQVQGRSRRFVVRPDNSVGERYVTAREVAERLGLSADTILRYYREGRIPGRRMSGTVRPVRFLWSEVEAAWDCE